MQRKRGTEFFDNSISVYLIVVFILVFGIMSCAKKESGTNDESYYTEERYYNSETEDVVLEDQKKYSMKRYVGTESTLRDAPECFGLDNFLYNYNEKLYKLWYIIEGGYYDKKRKKGSRI